MIKRTLYFGNPAVLRKKDQQLQVELCTPAEGSQASIPIEDIGVLILDHPQVTITQALLAALNEHLVAVINCDARHLPYGLMLPMFAHHAFTEKMYQQLESSLPLKKNLWQQTVIAKISNQAALLRAYSIDDSRMQYYLTLVKSGDPQNVEGRAAACYWENLFGGKASFTRHRFGEAPNALLNYGYAVLLAMVARGLVSSGLLPAVGIHHRNKYNPWCLASDIMEPYRPYVDRIVLQLMNEQRDLETLSPEIKRKLLQLPVIDVVIDGKNSPLMVGLQRTTASLSACFEGVSRKLLYPDLS
ncbi:MAG: type II CRISPR-associated endonuclease Cas1 [Bacteroidales bacterium]|nr:type II CRISPR-associated endonuclease Cas1 [Bacteroidales bacterium]